MSRPSSRAGENEHQGNEVLRDDSPRPEGHLQSETQSNHLTEDGTLCNDCHARIDGCLPSHTGYSESVRLPPNEILLDNPARPEAHLPKETQNNPPIEDQFLCTTFRARKNDHVASRIRHDQSVCQQAFHSIIHNGIFVLMRATVALISCYIAYVALSHPYYLIRDRFFNSDQGWAYSSSNGRSTAVATPGLHFSIPLLDLQKPLQDLTDALVEPLPFEKPDMLDYPGRGVYLTAMDDLMAPCSCPLRWESRLRRFDLGQASELFQFELWEDNSDDPDVVEETNWLQKQGMPALGSSTDAWDERGAKCRRLEDMSQFLAPRHFDFYGTRHPKKDPDTALKLAVKKKQRALNELFGTIDRIVSKLSPASNRAHPFNPVKATWDMARIWLQGLDGLHCFFDKVAVTPETQGFEDKWTEEMFDRLKRTELDSILRENGVTQTTTMTMMLGG